MRLKYKNLGNAKLTHAIDKLTNDLENNEIKSHSDLKRVRQDADKVHSSGVYFFDLYVHRTIIIISFFDSRAKILWAGNHQDYMKVFKNNKKTIERWLKTNEFI